jgi:hypothetical protein
MNGLGRLILMIIAAGFVLAGCGQAPTGAVGHADPPAQIEPIGAGDLHRITLTERAAQRLGIETAAVVERAGRLVLPYAAVFYDPDGQTWAYTNAEPNVFIRHAIAVESIDGQEAILSEGPPAGTAVVTVGVAELYGTEYEVGH